MKCALFRHKHYCWDLPSFEINSCNCNQIYVSSIFPRFQYPCTTATAKQTGALKPWCSWSIARVTDTYGSGIRTRARLRSDKIGLTVGEGALTQFVQSAQSAYTSIIFQPVRKSAIKRNGRSNIISVITYSDKEAFTVHEKFDNVVYLLVLVELFFNTLSYYVLVSQIA